MKKEGVNTGVIEEFSYSMGEHYVEVETSDGSFDVDGEEIFKMLKGYFNDVDKLDFKAVCDGGTCLAVASKQDSTYTGSKPRVVTKDNYKEYSDDLDKAVEDAVEKALSDSYYD